MDYSLRESELPVNGLFFSPVADADPQMKCLGTHISHWLPVMIWRVGFTVCAINFLEGVLGGSVIVPGDEVYCTTCKSVALAFGVVCRPLCCE